MAKSGNLITLVIVGGVLFFGYQYIQGHGGIQGLIDKLKGVTGGAAGGGGGGSPAATSAPCQGKDASGAACDCAASSTGNVSEFNFLPSNIAYATKKTAAPKAPAKAAKPAAGAAAKGAAGCDCSACTGAAGGTGAAAGGGVWGQNPASKTPCDLPGQSCPTIGALGGTNSWCKCVASGGGGAAAKGAKPAAGKGKGAATAAGLAHAMLAGADLEYGHMPPHVGISRNAYVPHYFSNVGYSS